MPDAQDLIVRARVFQERAEQALDPISRQHYLERAAHYRALAVEHQETRAARSAGLSMGTASGARAAGLSYLILAKHSFRRSSSKRTCASMASCNAAVPLLDNSAEAFLSRFCFQSRIACLVAVWASDAALRYVFMQASAIEHVLHS